MSSSSREQGTAGERSSEDIKCFSVQQRASCVNEKQCFLELWVKDDRQEAAQSPAVWCAHSVRNFLHTRMHPDNVHAL
jgi:hypothetical protein